MKVLDIRARSSKLEQILGFVNLTGKADFSVGFPSLSELALSEAKGLCPKLLYYPLSAD